MRSDLDRRPALHSLTGLRGVAAAMVFLTHCGLEPVFVRTAINHQIVHFTLGLGEAAVSFFFLLSGFVLVWASRSNDTQTAFWRRRVVKIYPNQVVVWSLALLMMVFTGEVTNFWALLPSLFLVHVWIPVASVVSGTDGPSWSLGCEMFFYLLFPFILRSMRTIPVERLARWVFAALGILVAITIVVGVAVPNRPEALGLPLAQSYLLLFFPPVRLIDFVLGMLMAHLVTAGRWPRVPWSVIAALVVAGWLAGVVLPAPLGFIVPMLPGSMLLIARCARSDIARSDIARSDSPQSSSPRSSSLRSSSLRSSAARPTTIFAHPRMVWLGDVSFAFYLVHWPVLHYSRVLLGGGPWSTAPAAGVLAADLVIALSLAHAVHRLVELPAMSRWGKSRGLQAASAPAPASPVAVE